MKDVFDTMKEIGVGVICALLIYLTHVDALWCGWSLVDYVGAIIGTVILALIVIDLAIAFINWIKGDK